MASNAGAKQSPLVRIKESAMANDQYPEPEATYRQVVSDRQCFFDTLKNLHASMKIKSMVPVIAGRELDLFQLFMEVTSRGGIEKVVNDKRWKEVTAAFNFPSSATNASFVLRRYYYTLLYNYEQLYYFRARGGTAPLQRELVTESPAQVTVQATPEYEAALPPRQRKTPVESCKANPNPASTTSSPVIGVIDGKFDDGYLITVTIGNKTLKGVLYQTPEDQSIETPVSHASVASMGNAPSVFGKQRRRRRKKCEIKRRDPDRPKPNRSGYNFFFADQHARLKLLHHGKDRQISKRIGELWNNIDKTQRAIYQEKAREDKERYIREMEDYRERKRTGKVEQGTNKMEETGVGSDPKSVDSESASDESDFEDDENMEVEEGYCEVDLNVDP